MDNNLQETDTYRQTTQPIILQPNFSQSYDYTDPDKTRATSLWLTWQLNGRKQVLRQRFQQEQLQPGLY